jgi:hypothetical protein
MTMITERPGWAPVKLEDGVVLAQHVATGKLYRRCSRCYGTGHYSFNPVDGTTCFGCRGRGYGAETTLQDEERKAANRAKARVRREAKAAEEAERDRRSAEAWRSEHAELVALLHTWAHRSDFLAELLDKAQLRPLTALQQASAWATVRRLQERDLLQQQRQELGHYPAEVGERITTEVIILSARYFPSERWDRTSQYLVTMRTPQGHTLKTWTSGAFGYDASVALETERPTWTITGTVKEHGEYNDTPETTLTRVKQA